MSKPLHTYRLGEFARADLVLGDKAIVIGQLMCVQWKCWLVPLNAARELSALSSGFRIQLPGLGAYVVDSAMARVTNGPVLASVPEAEVVGRILSGHAGSCWAEITAVSAVTLRKGEESDTVEISTLQQLTDRIQEELAFYRDRPEMQAVILEKFHRDREI